MGSLETLLPLEICVNILSFLSTKDIGALSSVCSFWNGCCENEIVWKERVKQFYPNYQQSIPDDVQKLSWKAIYRELIATLVWAPCGIDASLYDITSSKKTVKLLAMDECHIFSNTALVPNRSYVWSIQVSWSDDRFERYLGVNTKKRAKMNQDGWALQSRANQKSRCKSGDIIKFAFSNGSLIISVGGTEAIRYDRIPMKEDDPLYPFVGLYDSSDTATIVEYQSQVAIAKKAKASR